MVTSFGVAAKLHDAVGKWVEDHFDGLIKRIDGEAGEYGQEIECAVKLAVLSVILAQATTNEYRDEND